jgi:hypothetical protein
VVMFEFQQLGTPSEETYVSLKHSCGIFMVIQCILFGILMVALTPEELAQPSQPSSHFSFHHEQDQQQPHAAITPASQGSTPQLTNHESHSRNPPPPVITHSTAGAPCLANNFASPPHEEIPKLCRFQTALTSRTIAEGCCDVHPHQIHDGHAVEFVVTGRLHGEYSRTEAWPVDKIKTGMTVFVPSLDFPQFLNDVFLKLPRDVKLKVAVGGHEGVLDGFTPIFSTCAMQNICLCLCLCFVCLIFFVFLLILTAGFAELFGWSARKAYTSTLPMTIQEFLGDERLERVFIQNFDLTNCLSIWFNAHPEFCRDSDKCSGSCQELAKEDTLLQKVSFLPSGMNSGDWNANLCHLQYDVETIHASLPPWRGREMRLLSTLHPWGEPTVRKSHDHITQIDQSKISPNDLRWLFGDHMFVAVGQDYNVDPHLIWEALFFECVPIVITSPMDDLYKTLPVIIVNSWDEVSAAMMPTWREEIIWRFGMDPFNNYIRHQLTASYWGGRMVPQRLDKA